VAEPNPVPPVLTQTPVLPTNAPAAFGQPQLAQLTNNLSLAFNTILNEAGGNYSDPNLWRAGRRGRAPDRRGQLRGQSAVGPGPPGAPNTDKFGTVNLSVPTRPVEVTPDFNETSPLLFDPRLNPGNPNPPPVANPDYPFDQLPIGWLSDGRPVNAGLAPSPTALGVPRVFDTWSSTNDPYSPPPPVPGQPVWSHYYYGVPPIVPNPKGPNPPYVTNPNLALATSLADPLYANWNSNHFVGGLTEVAPLNNVPLRVRVRAIQLKLRIWDRKSSQARQVTIIQDL